MKLMSQMPSSSIVDFLYLELLTGRHGGDVDLLAVHAGPAAGFSRGFQRVEHFCIPKRRHSTLGYLSPNALKPRWD